MGSGSEPGSGREQRPADPGSLRQTPSQTVGPFFHFGLVHEGGNILAGPGCKGERIELLGRVIDGNGEPVPDALLEIWQPDAAGIFAHPGDPRHERADPDFRGFGRAATDSQGSYRFDTVKPGAVASSDPNERFAPSVNLHVFARGMLIHQMTRVFFAGEAANDLDPLLRTLPAEMRDRLLARPEPGSGARHYRFDLYLQGEQETPFFEP